MGEYERPAHHLIHMSDPHILGGPELLYGAVDSEANLVRALSELTAAGSHPEAIIFTGDLADTGDPVAYTKLRRIVEPVCEAMGSEVIWVMGNHDVRGNFRTQLFSQDYDDSPVDVVYTMSGLRIVTLDTTVPGFHYGLLDPDQLNWLGEVLTHPAPEGTVLAMHHPPVPCILDFAVPVELHEQRKLAEVLRGTDVRAILAGHLHYSTSATFAGIPVSVAAATCYTQDLVGMKPQSTGQGYNMVHVYDDTVVHSVVPLHGN